MHRHHIRRAHRGAGLIMRGAGLIVALAAASAWANPQPAPAATPGLPFRVVQEHVKVELNADFSFTETTERRVKLLSLQGVQRSRMMALGLPLMPAAPGLRLMHPNGGTTVVEAYTLKANGKQVPATRTQPPAPPPGLPPMHGPFDGATWMSFQQAQVGDVLVISYKGTYKGVPGAPGVFLLDEAFPKFLAMDEAEVVLTAPAAMKLNFRLKDVPPATHATSGGRQTWTWKFANAEAVAPSPGAFAYAAVHMSSFPSEQAEADFFTQRARAAQQMPGAPDACMDIPGVASDGPRGMQMLEVNLQMDYEHYPDRFEKEIDGLNSPDCVFDDGRPKITVLGSVFDGAIQPTPAGWRNAHAAIEKLKQQFPGQAFPALAEAEYWIVYAWDARGGGYAGSVTKEGWKLFGERLEKAEQVLIQSKPYASRFPTWYDQMVQVQFLLGRPAHDQAAVFQEGLARYKGYYPLYFHMVDVASPKWGGSWRAVDNFVRWSVEATQDKEAETLYARLYWYAYQGLMQGEELFRDTLVSWPKMKRGFDDLLARHPKSQWNLNNYAHFACMAGDKAAYRKLRKKMGKNVVPQAWVGAPTLDVCRARFGV